MDRRELAAAVVIFGRIRLGIRSRVDRALVWGGGRMSRLWRRNAFLLSYLLMWVCIIALFFNAASERDRICVSQKQTVASVTNAFEEFRKTVLMSYEQFPPDRLRRSRDAAFFNAVLEVLEPPDC